MDPDAVAALLKACKCCAHDAPVSYPSAPKGLSRALLPDVSCLMLPPNTPWTRLLFNREYVFVVNELLALRDDLIGSKPLIALVAAGKAPAELDSAMSKQQQKAWAVFLRARTYALEAAWGDSGLRHRGLLPKVPDVPVVPFVTVLRGKQMDWSEFWAYVEKERKEGCLKGKAAWADPQGALRTRMQRTLDALNKKFIELVKENSVALFSEDDSLRLVHVKLLNDALKLMEPLSAAARATKNHSANIPISLLEELQLRGQTARSWIAKTSRQAGNLCFERSNAATGQKKRLLQEQALSQYYIAVYAPEQSVVACANIAATYLQLKDYKQAITFATNGLISSDAYRAEPVSFSARRALTITELQTGKLTEPPAVPHRPQTAAEKKTWTGIIRKLYIRRGRAEAALVLSVMRPGNSISAHQEDIVHKLAKSATHSLESGFMLDPTDAAIYKESMQFKHDFDCAINAFNAALRQRDDTDEEEEEEEEDVGFDLD